MGKREVDMIIDSLLDSFASPSVPPRAPSRRAAQTVPSLHTRCRGVVAASARWVRRLHMVRGLFGFRQGECIGFYPDGRSSSRSDRYPGYAPIRLASQPASGPFYEVQRRAGGLGGRGAQGQV